MADAARELESKLKSILATLQSAIDESSGVVNTDLITQCVGMTRAWMSEFEAVYISTSIKRPKKGAKIRKEGHRINEEEAWFLYEIYTNMELDAKSSGGYPRWEPWFSGMVFSPSKDQAITQTQKLMDTYRNFRRTYLSGF